jgi:hypothetical protein
MAYPMLVHDHAAALAFFALGLAAINAAFGALTMRRVPEETLGALGFIGLGVAFLTIAVPVYLELKGVTLLWAVEGPVLLWLALRFQYKPLRWGALAVMTLAVLRLADVHGFYHDGSVRPVLNAAFGIWVFTAAAAAAFAWLWRGAKERSTYETMIVHGTGLVAAALAIGGLAGELRAYYAWGQTVMADQPGVWRFHPRTIIPSLTWLGGAFALYEAARRRAWGPAVWAGAITAVFAAFGTIMAYDRLVVDGFWWFVNPRFAAGAVSVAALAWIARKWPGDSEPKEFANASGTGLWIATGLAVFALLSLENFTVFVSRHADSSGKWIGQMAVTITWGLFAVSLLVLGFRLARRWVRLTALGLFGLAAAKLVLFDMAGIKQIWRILAFVAVGMLMIAASFLYHRVEQTLGEKETQ